MTMGKDQAAAVVKSGNVSIPIYFVPSKNTYRAVWVEDKRRRNMQKRDLDILKAKVRKVAQRLSGAVVEVASLSPEEQLIVAEIRRRGISLGDLDRLTGLPSPVTLGEAVNDFLEVVAANVTDTERNQRTLRGHCRSFEKAIGKKALLGQITPKQIDKWIRAGQVAPKTQHNRRASIITMFAWCRKKEMLQSQLLTAADRTDSPKVKKAGRKTIWTPSELKAMLENCRADYLPWLVISCFAGVRTNELCPEQRKGVGKDPLRWEDVKLDWDAPHIEIRPETSKTEDRRLIPICPTLLAWLQLLHKGTGRITPLKSPSRRNHNEPSITDELARAAGVEKWKVNANRHSFGSYRTAITKDLGLVSLEMGNSPQTVKSHYLEAVKQSQAEEFFALTPSVVKRPLQVVA